MIRIPVRIGGKRFLEPRERAGMKKGICDGIRGKWESVGLEIRQRTNSTEGKSRNCYVTNHKVIGERGKIGVREKDLFDMDLWAIDYAGLLVINLIHLKPVTFKSAKPKLCELGAGVRAVHAPGSYLWESRV